MPCSLPEGPLAFMPLRVEMSDVLSRCLPDRQLCRSRCLPDRQLSVSNLSRVATQWLAVDSNLVYPPVTRHRTYHYTTASRPIHMWLALPINTRKLFFYCGLRTLQGA